MNRRPHDAPAAALQYSSGGATNTVTRSSTGIDKVAVPDVGLNSGTVKVTEFGVTDSDRGQVSHWLGSPTLEPTSTSTYAPPAAYQENSTDATNEIDRSSTGFYGVILPNIGSDHGQVQITAYGTVPANCNPSSWAPTGTTEVAFVHCFDTAGNPVDSNFTVQYSR